MLCFLIICFSHGKSPCYFCNQIINGNVKIIFSEPSMNCHPDCLKVCYVFFCKNAVYLCFYDILSLSLLYMKLTLSMLLQCGVCARALGDMLTPMFLKDQVIQCGVCFSEAVKKWCLFGTNMFPENSPSIHWWMCCPLFPITSLSTSSFFLFFVTTVSSKRAVYCYD